MMYVEHLLEITVYNIVYCKCRLVNNEKKEATWDVLSSFLAYHCRSGNRSKQAAEKLGKMGYYNVYEFGGITDWKGEIVTTDTKTEAILTFDSFDGGGSEYDIELDSAIVTCTRNKEYLDANHDELDGAAFRLTYTFIGMAPGETAMTVKERSPIAGNFDHKYSVRVDEKLNVSIEKLETIDRDEAANAVQPVPSLMIAANGKVFCGELEDNPSAQAFIEKLSSEAIEVEIRRNLIINNLRECRATSPETAKTLSEAGVINPNGFKLITERLAKTGEIKKAGENNYYI